MDIRIYIPCLRILFVDRFEFRWIRRHPSSLHWAVFSVKEIEESRCSRDCVLLLSCERRRCARAVVLFSIRRVVNVILPATPRTRSYPPAPQPIHVPIVVGRDCTCVHGFGSAWQQNVSA